MYKTLMIVALFAAVFVTEVNGGVSALCSTPSDGPAGPAHGKPGVEHPDPSSRGGYRETWLCILGGT